MGLRKRIGRLVCTAVAVAIGSLALSATASATVTCTTDDFGRPGVSITGQDAVGLRVVGGAISYDPGANNDVFFPCGNATVTSTDTIFVGGELGTAQGLVIDLSGGQFAPGFSTGGESIPEIEWVVNLRGGGGSVPDTVWVRGSEGGDRLRAAGTGEGGLAGITRGLELNWFVPSGPGSFDTDLDVTFPEAVPEVIKLLGEGGPDALTGRTTGYEGADPAYLLQFEGGPADDVITATGRRGTRAHCKRQGSLAFAFTDFIPSAQNDRWECLIGDGGEDRLFGEPGGEKILGLDGRDRLRGGAGPDRLIGGDGEDNCDGGPGEDIERDCELGP